MTDVIGPKGVAGWLNDTAAPQFNALQYAALDHWGYMMPVTSAGRTKTEQGRLYNGWINRLPGFYPAYHPDSPYALHVVNGGQAVDVGGEFGRYETRQHEWLAHWGPLYGFEVDAVDGEPWHIQLTLPIHIFATTKVEPIEEAVKSTLLESDINMPLYIRPTENSSPDGSKPSRIWSGDGREFKGIKYSGVWELTSPGARRLTEAEWKAVQGAYAAAGATVPVTSVTGNEAEIIVYAPNIK